MKRTHPLIIIGLLAIAVAGLWYWLGKPSDSEARTDEVSCAFQTELTHPGGDTSHCTGRPAGPTTGPLLLAGSGAFAVLLGTIRMQPRQGADNQTGVSA